MSILKDRVLVARAAIIIMGGCGLVGGYFLGCVLALQLSKSWLVQNAEVVAAQYDASFVEAKNLMAALKDSPNSFCSENEISHFRQLVFRSDYVKDIGRTRGGKVECSATEGHLAHPVAQFKAQLEQQDGATAYTNLVPLHDSGLKRAGLQVGTAYVVFGSQLPQRVGPIPMQLAFNTRDSSIGQEPAANPNENLVSTKDETGRQGDTLFATRCSTQNQSCVTASAPVSDSLNAELIMITGTTLALGILGTLLGVGFSFVYNRSRDLRQQLRRAISDDKIQLLYQPIVNLNSGKVVGAEALARWNDEDGNPVSPDIFVKIAEECGFVGDLTSKVIARALRSFSDTLHTYPDFRLSVNVSGADLTDPNFLPMLNDTLKRAKVDAKSLVIEITERSTAENAVAMETIRELRRREHSVHIDDFGTGYSNLDKLLYLFADTIKIDKAFTRVIGTEAVTAAILPQILAMAKSLNLDVIVEGVETELQAYYFSSVQQKIYAQGWLYGRPISAEEFRRLLAGDAPRATAEVETGALLPVSAMQRPRVA